MGRPVRNLRGRNSREGMLDLEYRDCERLWLLRAMTRVTVSPQTFDRMLSCVQLPSLLTFLGVGLPERKDGDDRPSCLVDQPPAPADLRHGRMPSRAVCMAACRRERCVR